MIAGVWPYLRHHVVHELLASKAGFHGHDQSHVDLIGPRGELFNSSTRLYGQTHLQNSHNVSTRTRKSNSHRHLFHWKKHRCFCLGLHYYFVTFMPLSLISLMRLPGLVVDSMWNVYWLAPAAAMGFTHCSGRDTIMCMSAKMIRCIHDSFQWSNWGSLLTCVGVPLPHQRKGLGLPTSLGTLPWGGQRSGWEQSALKGETKK